MKIGNKDTEKEVFLVAEIGNNHEGSEALASRMIEAAAAAGADAVKFQTFKTELYQSPLFDKARYQRLKSFELPQEAFLRLAETAKRYKVLFFSSPFDLDSVRFLDSFAPCFKIASADNNFWPLLDLVARTGKPVILSSGLADLEQIRKSRSFIEGIWKERNIRQELAVLHCVTSYPVPAEQANLASIPFLREELGGTVGYSDHTLGLDACAAALALGARIIEKHFTLDKNQSDFRDHKLSAAPEEFAELAKMTRDVPRLLGAAQKKVQDCEKEYIPLVRRSIAAKRDLPQGTKIQIEDLVWVRPGHGLPPGSEANVIGRSVKRDVLRGEFLVSDVLAP